MLLYEHHCILRLSHYLLQLLHYDRRPFKVYGFQYETLHLARQSGLSSCKCKGHCTITAMAEQTKNIFAYG